MKIGFTGTQIGMNENQISQIKKILGQINIKEIHVGDCVGADTDFYNLIKSYNKTKHTFQIKTIGHVPIYDFKRSFLKYDEEREPKPYIERNHDIVNESDLLIVCPKEKQEQLRSGTWATYRYAKKISKPILIFYP